MSNSIAKINRISSLSNCLLVIMFFIIACICIMPLIFVFIISISSEKSISTVGYSFWPQSFSFEAYKYLWLTRDTIGRSFVVSILVTAIGTILGLILNANMGYVLSRRSFALRKFCIYVVFIPMLFTGGMVANYMVMTQLLRLKDNLFALILPGVCSSFYIIVLRTFFQTMIPDSIIESAKIDGANQFRIFAQVVVPISTPALATIGLFLSFAYWNDWFNALMYINNPALYPLQFVLMSIQRQIDLMLKSKNMIGAMYNDISSLPSESCRMAIVMVVVIPITCSYPFFQKYFISGLTIGAIKG